MSSCDLHRYWWKEGSVFYRENQLLRLLRRSPVSCWCITDSSCWELRVDQLLGSTYCSPLVGSRWWKLNCLVFSCQHGSCCIASCLGPLCRWKSAVQCTAVEKVSCLLLISRCEGVEKYAKFSSCLLRKLISVWEKIRAVWHLRKSACSALSHLFSKPTAGNVTVQLLRNLVVQQRRSPCSGSLLLRKSAV